VQIVILRLRSHSWLY